jgi:hypothetical protein
MIPRGVAICLWAVVILALVVLVYGVYDMCTCSQACSDAGFYRSEATVRGSCFCFFPISQDGPVWVKVR